MHIRWAGVMISGVRVESTRRMVVDVWVCAVETWGLADIGISIDWREWSLGRWLLGARVKQ